MTNNEIEKQNQEQKFIMLPSVDFCFQELMEDKEILKGFCGAILCVSPEEIEELPKLAQYAYPQTELLRWAQFFGAKSREEIQMLAEKDEYIRKAYRRLEEMSADEQKRWEYEMRQKAIRDQRHMWLVGGEKDYVRDYAKER